MSKNSEFVQDVLGDVLDTTLDWIQRNLSVDDVFSEQEIIRYVRDRLGIEDVWDSGTVKEHIRENYEPEDVWSYDTLVDWAKSQGYEYRD